MLSYMIFSMRKQLGKITPQPTSTVKKKVIMFYVLVSSYFVADVVMMT